MAILKFFTHENEIKILVWPEAWEAYKLELQSGKTLVLEGVQDDDESKIFILNNLISGV